MTDRHAMIDSTSDTSSVELEAAIDALDDCASASTACAMAMVASGGMATEVRRALDCADVTQAAARVLSRGPASDLAVISAVVDAAAVTCEASAAACGAHAEHHVHCRLHSESARACVDALRNLQKAARP